MIELRRVSFLSGIEEFGDRHPMLSCPVRSLTHSDHRRVFGNLEAVHASATEPFCQVNRHRIFNDGFRLSNGETRPHVSEIARGFRRHATWAS